jgi:hypothetical protein
MRLKDWNTKPTRSRRSRVSAVSPRPVRATPPMVTSPAVGRSSPAAQCSRVDLPEPDGPITVVNVPTAKLTVTVSRAVTGWAPAA